MGNNNGNNRKYWYDGKISNLGYAFVNFTNPTAASEFCEAFHLRQWDVEVNKKVCEIKIAKLQVPLKRRRFRFLFLYISINYYICVFVLCMYRRDWRLWRTLSRTKSFGAMPIAIFQLCWSHQAMVTGDIEPFQLESALVVLHLVQLRNVVKIKWNYYDWKIWWYMLMMSNQSYMGFLGFILLTQCGVVT